MLMWSGTVSTVSGCAIPSSIAAESVMTLFAEPGSNTAVTALLSLLGTASAGPMADSIDTPEWKKFVADYKANFKDGFPSPSLFAYLYYINAKATLDALDAVKGDLSNNQAALRKTLSTMTLKTPTGDVKLDANRNAVANIYITEVAKNADGTLYNKVVKSVPNVTQTLGLSKEEFTKMGLGSRDVPDCRK